MRPVLDVLGPLEPLARNVGAAIGTTVGWVGSFFAPAEAGVEAMNRWTAAGKVFAGMRKARGA